MTCPGCNYDSSLVVTARYEFTIPMKWYSLNEIRSNTKNNRKYKYVRDKYIVKVGAHKGDIPPAETYRRLYLTRVYGLGPRGGACREFDFASLVGGGKPLVDAIVWNGLLVDDNPNYVDEYYYQERSTDGKHYIRIVLEDVER